MATSSSEIALVNAVNVSSRKNSGASTTPPGISENAIGIVVKTSPGPWSGSRPTAKMIGNRMSPASNATDVSSTLTVIEVDTRSSSVFR